MTIVRMKEKDMENLSTCKDCCHFHRYTVRSMIRLPLDKEIYGKNAENEVEIENRERTLYRCLVGRAFSPELEDNVVVNCSQFDRRESKRKL